MVRRLTSTRSHAFLIERGEASPARSTALGLYCRPTSMLVQRTLMRGFAATDATMVLAFNFIRLPTAALAGFVFFAEVPEIWVWIGGAVIFASSILLARRENALERGSAEPTRSDGA